MHTYRCFGIWVKSLRLTQGWTQHELAQRIGCSVSTIRKIETRERHPSRQVAELLDKHLAVSPDVAPAFLQAANCIRQSPKSDVTTALPNSQVTPDLTVRPLDPNTQIRDQHGFRPLSPILGRSAEIAAAAALLQRADLRLLTVLGPGGVGKTRLAYALADYMAPAFTHGVWWCWIWPLFPR